MNEVSNPMLFSRKSKRLGTVRVLRRRSYNACPMPRKPVTEEPHRYNPVKHKQRIAFHVAGHATAIYLNIKARNLPPVFFQIMLQALNTSSEEDFGVYHAAHQACGARIEGGRLIEVLPAAIDTNEPNEQNRNNLTGRSINDPMKVYEADIINLLAGPLAEARHVAETDNEVFSPQLINLDALQNYGGQSDLALVKDYLHSFSTSQQQREEKLGVLFNIAIRFINDRGNWADITKLANSILNSRQEVIDYEAVVSLLEHECF